MDIQYRNGKVFYTDNQQKIDSVYNAPRYAALLTGHSFVKRWRNSVLPDLDRGVDADPSVVGDLRYNRMNNVLLEKLRVDQKINRFYTLEAYFIDKLLEPETLNRISTSIHPHLIMVDIISNNLTLLNCRSTKLPDEDPVFDGLLLSFLGQLKEFASHFRNSTVVFISTLPRVGNLRTGDIEAASTLFEHRRLALNSALKQMEQESFDGFIPPNIRYYRMLGWNKSDIAEWSTDGIHPTDRQLKDRYTSNLKRLILDVKHHPATLVLLRKQLQPIASSPDLNPRTNSPVFRCCNGCGRFKSCRTTQSRHRDAELDVDQGDAHYNAHLSQLNYNQVLPYTPQ